MKCQIVQKIVLKNWKYTFGEIIRYNFRWYIEEVSEQDIWLHEDIFSKLKSLTVLPYKSHSNNESGRLWMQPVSLVFRCSPEFGHHSSIP